MLCMGKLDNRRTFGITYFKEFQMYVAQKTKLMCCLFVLTTLKISLNFFYKILKDDLTNFLRPGPFTA